MMHRWIRLARKFGRLPSNRKWLVVEAAFYLFLARFAVAVLPFGKLVWFLERRPKSQGLCETQRGLLRKEVSWAIAATAAHLPGKTVCFPRGIAAQAMLRRRGIAATLYYGAATIPDEGFVAHVWVQDGEQGVVGHLEAGQFNVLAVYPTAA